MQSEWRTLPLDQIYDFASGLSKPRSEFGSGYPFLSFKDVFNNIFIPDPLTEMVNSTDKERFALSIRRGDVFLTRTSETMDELGMSCVALRDVPQATFNGFTKRLRPKSDTVVPEYAGYFFRSPKFRQELTAMSSMSTRASLNNEMLSRLRISIPAKREQEKIGHTLKAFDDKIHVNRQMNETLEAMAQALFKSWFIDFDPVRAKHTRQENVDNISSCVGVCPDGFEGSELGHIPKGWNVRSVYDCGTFTNGVAFSKVSFSSSNSGLPIVKIAELKDGVTAQTKFTNDELAEKHKIRDGDILFSWSGSPDTSIDTFVWAGGDGWLNQHIFKVESSSPQEKLFVYYLLKYLKPVFIEIARDKQTTGLGHVTAQDLKRLKVIFPSVAVLAEFDKIVEPLFKRSFETLTESRTLAALRDALLPKLLSGRVRIKASTDAEDFLNA